MLPTGVNIVQSEMILWYADGKSYRTWHGHHWNSLPQIGIAIIEYFYRADNGKWYIERELGEDEYHPPFPGRIKKGFLMSDDAWLQLYNQVIRIKKVPPDGNNSIFPR